MAMVNRPPQGIGTFADTQQTDAGAVAKRQNAGDTIVLYGQTGRFSAYHLCYADIRRGCMFDDFGHAPSILLTQSNLPGFQQLSKLIRWHRLAE